VSLAEVVKYLPSKHEALNSIPSNTHTHTHTHTHTRVWAIQRHIK
jgi:hypothetical protein